MALRQFGQSPLFHFNIFVREFAEQDTNDCTRLYIKCYGVKWIDYASTMAINDYLKMAESGLKSLDISGNGLKLLEITRNY